MSAIAAAAPGASASTQCRWATPPAPPEEADMVIAGTGIERSGGRCNEPHRNALRRRDEASLGMVRDRHERIALRIIGGEAAGRNVVGMHDEAVDAATDAVLDGRHQAHDLAFRQCEALDVAPVHEKDPG